ncbi:MAG TPA: PASTA domain-containing protein [Candidatus Acidoferrales bacterium]|nr:PASTA domain-containing protein [Candidatus Acidoferrales bacterium]
MGFRERSEWVGRMALLIFVLASVAFLSAILTMRFAIQGREIVTPDVTRVTLSRAQAQLERRRLHLRVEDRIYSSLPPDTIARQSPPAGTRLKVGEWVHVVVSLGQQKVTIPQLDDRSFRAAQIELLSEGLQTGEVSSAYLPEFPTDVVLQQDPPAGSTNASSPHVDVLVSLGAQPPAYVMPGFEGLTLVEAEQRLSAAGLKVSKVTPLPLTGRPSGTVTSQLPLRGTRVEPGASVELQVAQ